MPTKSKSRTTTRRPRTGTQRSRLRVERTSADLWLGLQLDWDLWHVLRSDGAKVIAKLSPLPRAS